MNIEKIFDAFEIKTELPSEKLVLLALGYLVKPYRHDPNPSLHDISRVTGLSMQTIRKALKSLEKQGLIVKTDIPGCASEYVLLWGE